MNFNETFKNISGYEIGHLPFSFEKEADSIDRHICVCVTNYKGWYDPPKLDNEIYFIVRHFHFPSNIEKQEQDKILEQITRNIKDYGIWDDHRLYPPGGIKFIAIDSIYEEPKEIWSRSLNE